MRITQLLFMIIQNYVIELVQRYIVQVPLYVGTCIIRPFYNPDTAGRTDNSSGWTYEGPS